MIFERILLKAYGPFHNQTLDFAGSARPGLHLIHGPNEAGKSSALRAIHALFFGIPAQTRDNFRHDYPALRIGAVFRDEDGQRRTAMRRKGNQATLFEFDPESGEEQPDRRLPPDFFAGLLGQIGQDTFRNLFGIDHAHLRTGGQELLEGRGEVGEALFQAASGLTGVRRTLAELEAEAEALFKARGQNPPLNAALREHAEAVKRFKAACVRPAEWREGKDEFEKAERQVKALQARAEQLRAEEALNTRRRIAIPLGIKRAEALRELEELRGAALLDPGAGELRIKASARLAHAEEDRQAAEALIASHEQALAGLDIPAPLLASGPDIETLHRGLLRAAEAADRSLAEAAALSPVLARIDELAASLYGDRPAPEVPDSLPAPAATAQLRELAKAMLAVHNDAASHRQQLREIELDRAEAQAARERLPAVRDLSGVAAALAAIQRKGDLEAECARQAAELAVAERRLTAQAAALGAPDAEALRRMPVPAGSEAEQFAKAIETLRADAAKLDTEQANIQRDLDEVLANMEAVEAAGAVVTAETVATAREDRDGRWSRIRCTLLEGGADRADSAPAADAYEAAVHRADDLADMLRMDTARATEYTGYARRRDRMQARLNEIARERERLQAGLEAQSNAWNQRTASLGLAPMFQSTPLKGEASNQQGIWMTPEGFKDWLAERRNLLQWLESHEAKLAERVATEREIESARRSLAAACREAGLAEAAGAELGLGVALAQAVRKVEEARRMAEEAERIAADIQRLERDRQRVQAKLDQAQEREAALRGQWETAMVRCRLPASTAPEDADRRAGELDALRNALAEQRRLQEAVAGEQAVLDVHRALAARVAAALGVPAPADPEIPTFAERLHGELAAARTRGQRKAHLEESLAKERERLAKAGAEQATAAAELKRLVEAAGCEAPAELPEAESRSSRRRELEGWARDLEQQMVAQGGKSLDDLLAESEGCSLEAVEQRLAELREELSGLEPEREAAFEALNEARTRFKAMDGGAEAAEIREGMEATLARIRRDAERYAQLKLAHALLRDGLQRHRENTQGPLLGKAAGYFGVITGQRYASLAIDFEDDRQILAAVRPDGERLRVGDLSEGTADQLYLALRLAAIDAHCDSSPRIPLVLDDILMTFDDARSGHALRALSDLGGRTQILLFTHHRHVLDIARDYLDAEAFGVIELEG
jgi:uncharacterized protein YhaN